MAQEEFINTLLEQHANSLSLSQWQPISALWVRPGRKSINDKRSEIMMEHCVAGVWRNVSALFYCVIRQLMRALMNNMLSISIGKSIEERGHTVG